MKLFYSDRCALHNPEFEILSGNATPYLESPSRMMAIMSHIAQDERTSSWSWENIDSSKDSGELPVDAIEAINRVHHPDYVEYLRNAYEVWVQDGGSKVCPTRPLFSIPAHMIYSSRQRFCRKRSRTLHCSRLRNKPHIQRTSRH